MTAAGSTRNRTGVEVTIKGKVLSGPVELKHDEVKGGPDEVEVGGIAMWVHLSGDRRTIRMRDDHGEGRDRPDVPCTRRPHTY